MNHVTIDGYELNGKVDWDGEIILYLTLGRTMRNGKWEELKYRIPKFDTDQAACVRRTLRRLAEESIGNKKREVEREEQTLNES